MEHETAIRDIFVKLKEEKEKKEGMNNKIEEIKKEEIEMAKRIMERIERDKQKTKKEKK